jgi:hypothetical protein
MVLSGLFFTESLNQLSMKTKKFLGLAIVLCTLHSALYTVEAQGTAFTYQGSLSANAVPANGFFDFEFSLYTNATGAGDQVGSALTETNIGVTNGIFTTTLDFGGVFNGNATWLAISVRSNGVGSYTGLTPLQELTPAPYAVFANMASNVSGTIPAAQLSGTISNALLPSSLTFSGIITAEAFSGDGGALTNLNASQLVSGTIPLAQLPGAVVTNNEANVSLVSLTLSSNLTLPSPATLYSGGGSLLFADANANFFAGQSAGNLNTSGVDNTAIGQGALAANATGNKNVSAGYEALARNTDDSELVAIGYKALQNDNAGDNVDTSSGNGENTAIGFLALQSDTLGYQNTAVGYDALGANTTGTLNTAIGDHALSFNTTGSFNTADGDHALFMNTIGIGNIAIGPGALDFNTSGSYNTALGTEALDLNTNGSYNTAIGLEALVENTTGSYNTAIGLQALFDNETGSNNTAIGLEALSDNQTGSNNTANGVEALEISTGNNNVAMGYQAGINIATGNNNIDIGNLGVASDDSIIRIGTANVQVNGTFIAGISGASLPGGQGAPVFVNAGGQLGTTGANNAFTPTIGDGTNNFTAITNSGYYTQVGNLVYFEIWLQWSDQGSANPSANLQISLPVAVASQRVAFPLGFMSGVSFGSQLTAGASNGQSDILLYSLSNSGAAPSQVLVSSCSTSGEIQISGSYRWQ